MAPNTTINLSLLIYAIALNVYSDEVTSSAKFNSKIEKNRRPEVNNNVECPTFGVEFHHNQLGLTKNSSSKPMLKLTIMSTDVVGCCDLFNRRLQNDPIRHCRFVARCEKN